MMKKWCGSACFALGFLSFVPPLLAQAVYTAEKTSKLQAGAGYLYLENDYAYKDWGMSVWVDGNLNKFFGIEGVAHFGVLISPKDLGENSYLVGPRFTIHQGKGSLYAKALVGRGDFIIDAPGRGSSVSYDIYAFGGGFDYKVNRAWSVRVGDAEFQTWPNFKPRGLTPYTISSGLMYTFSFH